MTPLSPTIQPVIPSGLKATLYKSHASGPSLSFRRVQVRPSSSDVKTRPLSPTTKARAGGRITAPKKFSHGLIPTPAASELVDPSVAALAADVQRHNHPANRIAVRANCVLYMHSRGFRLVTAISVEAQKSRTRLKPLRKRPISVFETANCVPSCSLSQAMSFLARASFF